MKSPPPQSPPQDNDAYWSWHDQAVAKANAVPKSAPTGSAFTRVQARLEASQPKSPPTTTTKSKPRLSAAIRAEESKPNKMKDAYWEDANLKQGVADAMARAEVAQTRSLEPAPKAATKENKEKLPASEKAMQWSTRKKLLVGGVAILIAVLVVQLTASRGGNSNRDGSSDTDSTDSNQRREIIQKEQYLACMKRLQTPQNGTCHRECLREVVEDGFGEWKMQCVPEKDRNTLYKKQTLACNCQSLVPGYLDHAETCCAGNLSLVSKAAVAFCEDPQSFKPKLLGVFKRDCELNDLPDYAERQDAETLTSVLGMALLASLAAGMAIAGLVAYSREYRFGDRNEASTAYVSLSA